MALLQQTRILPNQRLDLPDYRNIEDFMCADLKALAKNIWTNSNFVVSGFEPTGGSIGSDTLSLVLSGSSCIMGQDDGVTFIGAPSLAPLSTQALTPNAVNYVELTIDKDTGGADSRAFWDSTANGGLGGEFSQIVDTYVFLKANFSINTSNFTGDANKIRICTVTVNNAGIITDIDDERNLLYRLGKAGNPGYTFPWASRTEPLASQFTGADKDIKNLKQLLDALMDSIREIKSTNYWFEELAVSLPGAFANPGLTILSGTSDSAKFAWDGNALTITDDAVSPLQSDVIAYIRIFSSIADLALTRQSAINAISIADKEVLWVELPSPYADVTYDGLGLTAFNYHVSALGSVPLDDTSYWLAYREGTRLYVRGLGELNPGESVEVSDQVPDALQEFLGFNPETATSVPYTAVPNPSIFGNLFNTSSSLVTAISANTANINAVGLALDTNVYDESAEVVAGSGPDVFITQATDNTISLFLTDNADTGAGTGDIGGQSFMATATGEVTSIDFNVYNDSGTPVVGGNLRMAIYSTLGGPPGPLSGLLGTSDTVPVASIPVGPGGNTTFTFSTPIPVINGITYYAVVFSEGATYGGGAFLGKVSSLNPYADGTLLTGTIPTTNSVAGSDAVFSITISQPVVLGPNEIAGPVAANTILTIPTDSRDSNAQEEYVVGAGLLTIYLNGQLLELGYDWDEVGTIGNLSSDIEILQDLEVGDRLIFRIGSLGGFNVGASSGEANTASNVGGAAEVFKQKSGVDLEFRTIVAGSNVSVVQAANTITISSTGGGGGGTDSVTEVSSDYTILGTDAHVRVDAGTGAKTITLPDAASVLGKKYVIKKVDATGNLVNLQTVLSQQIDGLTLRTLTTQYQTISIISVGTGWDIQ
jgi:hypothetical protein